MRSWTSSRIQITYYDNRYFNNERTTQLQRKEHDVNHYIPKACKMLIVPNIARLTKNEEKHNIWERFFHREVSLSTSMTRCNTWRLKKTLAQKKRLYYFFWNINIGRRTIIFINTQLYLRRWYMHAAHLNNQLTHHNWQLHFISTTIWLKFIFAETEQLQPNPTIMLEPPKMFGSSRYQ